MPNGQMNGLQKGLSGTFYPVCIIRGVIHGLRTPPGSGLRQGLLREPKPVDPPLWRSGGDGLGEFGRHERPGVPALLQQARGPAEHLYKRHSDLIRLARTLVSARKHSAQPAVLIRRHKCSRCQVKLSCPQGRPKR
jgi:hypothetical protein